MPSVCSNKPLEQLIFLFRESERRGEAVNCAAGSMLARRTPYNASCLPPCPPIRDPAVPITRRRVFGMLAGAAVAVGVPSVWMSRMKTYDGPRLRSFRRPAILRSRWRAAEIAGGRCCAGSSAAAGSARTGRIGCRALMPTRRRRASRAARCGCPLSGMRAG